MFIIVKIKCVNSSNIGDKLKFTINYTHFTTMNTYYNIWHMQQDGPIVGPKYFRNEGLVHTFYQKTHTYSNYRST